MKGIRSTEAKWAYTAEIAVPGDLQVNHDNHPTIQVGDIVLADSEARAREYAEHVLEEQYPGEDGYILLSLDIESI